MGFVAFACAALLCAPAAAQPSAPQESTATVNGSPSASTATLAAVGDIRLDGPVGELISRHGPRRPLSAIRGLLQADIVLGNLECSVTRRGEKQPKTWNFRAPPRNLESLKGVFDVLNLANNHVWDYGQTGFTDTLAAVKKRGFTPIGGGKDLAEASSAAIIEANGLRVGLLGFTSTFPKQAWAKRGKPGVNYSDFDRFPEIIARARKLCDVLVVSFHGGTELAEEPNEIQKGFARMAVDSGADLVLGHHPHVIQAAEVYKGKPILYSLGNFLFVSPSTATRYTVIATAALGPEGVSRIELTPVDTNWGTPIPAAEEGRQAVYAALNRQGALTSRPDLFSMPAEAVEGKPSDKITYP